MMEKTLEQKVKEEMQIISHWLKKGYSLKEIYDIMEEKYYGVWRIILSEYVKKEKEKGNTKLFDEFMRTCFI